MVSGKEKKQRSAEERGQAPCKFLRKRKEPKGKKEKTKTRTVPHPAAAPAVKAKSGERQPAAAAVGGGEGSSAMPRRFVLAQKTARGSCTPEEKVFLRTQQPH